MDLIDKICREVAELPDRTSPEDFPDAMLVTADELRSILRPALAQAEAGNKVGWRMLADVEPPDGEIILASDGNRRWQDIWSPHGVMDFYFSHRRHVATMWHPIAPLPDNAALSASPRDGLEDRPTDGEGWQDIETAPKDGHRILLSGAMQGVRWTAVAHWASRQWEDDWGYGFPGNATHWQPLPAPPASVP